MVTSYIGANVSHLMVLPLVVNVGHSHNIESIDILPSVDSNPHHDTFQ